MKDPELANNSENSLGFHYRVIAHNWKSLQKESKIIEKPKYRVI